MKQEFNANVKVQTESSVIGMTHLNDGPSAIFLR